MVHSQHIQGTRSGRKVWAIALMGLVLCGSAAQTLAPDSAIALPRNPVAQASPRVPQRVALQVRRDLAQRLNLPLRDVRIVQSSRETWTDGCLGLGRDNERCTMGTVEGWRIELTNGPQNWVYRTDLTGQRMRLETQDEADLPAPVVDRLFQTIARQARVPAHTLKVVESQPRTWDGCMGIFIPDQACTMIAIPGYRVIVMGDRQSWVYHVNQDGSEMVQNETASGGGSAITPSFMPEAAEPSTPDRNVVFKMTLSGSMDGSVTETTLTADGVISRRTTRMGNPTTATPTVLKRLSPRQVAQFKQLLEQQRFPNLNGMRYLTSAALADYPTTVFQTMNGTVAYIDLEQNHLPASLQRIIQTWNRLVGR